METAIFSQGQPLPAYAKANGITSVDVVKNPNTDKHFVQFNNGETARVSNKVIENNVDLKTCFVSMFTPEEGEPSLMVHTTNRDNVVQSVSFD